MITAVYFHGQWCFYLTVRVELFPSCSYSSGAMYVWNVTDDDGPVSISHSAQLHSPIPTNCAIHQSGFGVVGNSDGKFSGLGVDESTNYYSHTPFLNLIL